MFPGGINPKNLDPKAMQRMMGQLGIKSNEVEADRVIIEGKGGRIVIEPVSVTAVEFGGRKTYTVMGEERKEQPAGRRASEEDIDMVVKQAGVPRKKAEAALKKNDGDIALAILELKGEK